MAVHSFTSAHVAVEPLPLAAKPSVQEQLKLPGAFVQTFATLRSRPQAVVGAHSFTSVQVPPLGDPE